MDAAHMKFVTEQVLPRIAVQEAIDKLAADGLVYESSDGRWALTEAGKAYVEANRHVLNPVS